mgnify:CR=1 FL=1
MAHRGTSAPLLYTNGAPVGDAPLVWKTLMAHQRHGAPLVLIFFHFSIHTNGASGRNGAPGRPCAITVFFYSFFCKTTNGALSPGAPLLV